MSDVAAFLGPVPQHYDQHMGPVMFEPFAQEAARRVNMPPGARLLETAAGTGRVTRHLAARLPADGRLLATDLSRDMLDLAKTRVGDPRVEFRVADAQDLQLPEGSFDAAVCQFGIMFCPDKAKATSEAFRALRPGGQYLYSVWSCLDDNPHCRALHELVLQEFPDDPPMFYEVPFGSSDRDMNLQMMEAAGFTSLGYEAVQLPVVAESVASLAQGVVRGGPLSAMLVERNADLDAFVEKVANRLGSMFGHEPMRSTMTAIFVTGEKRA